MRLCFCFLRFGDIAVGAVDRVSAGVIIPGVAFMERVPLRLRSLIGDACQCGAAFKRSVPDVCDAARDRDACQIVTIGKRIRLNNGDAEIGRAHV